MKVGKPKSKRTPVRLRHKIEKASANKQRKARKDAKKNPQWRSRLKKDPGIPNLFPYKAKVLAEIEEGRRKKEEDSVRRREIAKAQKQGTAATGSAPAIEPELEGDEDEELLDEPDDVEEEDEMDVRDEGNPMAALLASAQARAQSYSKGGLEAEDDDEDDDDENDDWDGIDESGASAPGQATRKALPKQALADPVKAVSALLIRMQKTQDGIQRLIDHYQIPPLVTAGSDTTTRFLVEVARKRGRLGRGGVPNVHAAALAVLTDLNEDNLDLPAETVQKPASVAATKGEVQIVKEMAEPFRIEGLFGDENARKGDGGVALMEVET